MNVESHRAQGLASADLAVTDFDKAIFSKVKNAQIAANIVDSVNEWTGGQVFLTRLIYQYIQQYSAQIIKAEGADVVDEVVRQKIIKNWEYNAAAAHFKGIEQVILNHPSKDAVLIVYTQILWHGSVAANTLPNMESEEVVLLRSGLVECIDNELYIANTIYASVFDKKWVERQIPSHIQKVSAKRRTKAHATAFSVKTAARPTTGPSFRRSPSLSSRPSANQAANRAARQPARQPGSPPPQKAQPPKPSNAHPLRQKVLLAGTLIFAGAAALVCVQLLRTFGFMNSGFDDVGAIAAPSYQRPASPSASPTDSQSDSQLDGQLDSKTLFDTGIEHATNARWLPMLQNFCSIPASSAYFVPAQQQLDNWIDLYPEDLQQAFAGLYTQPTQTCPLAKITLN